LALLVKEIAEVEQLVREQRGTARRVNRRKRAYAVDRGHDQGGMTMPQRDFSVEY
jgi:hypothetical protein